jgi:hypothetical protein|tara:strand:+ start:27519 stop:28265 length:747 start_codon:yes stop_codon:yes gene_type:complete
MLNFHDAIVEHKFFDNNGRQMNPSKAEFAVITLARTEGNSFGDKWHAIAGVGGHRVGGDGDKNMKGALRWGLVTVISDKAAQADVVIERGFQTDKYTSRYDQRVVVDGEHVATFTPYSGNEYILRDRSGEAVLVHPEAYGYGRHAVVLKKADMLDTVRKWFEVIPSDKDIAKREAAEKQAEEDKAAEQAESDRIWKIQQAGPELLEALKMIADFNPDLPLYQSHSETMRVLKTKVAVAVETISGLEGK